MTSKLFLGKKQKATTSATTGMETTAATDAPAAERISTDTQTVEKPEGVQQERLLDEYHYIFYRLGELETTDCPLFDMVIVDLPDFPFVGMCPTNISVREEWIRYYRTLDALFLQLKSLVTDDGVMILTSPTWFAGNVAAPLDVDEHENIGSQIMGISIDKLRESKVIGIGEGVKQKLTYKLNIEEKWANRKYYILFHPEERNVIGLVDYTDVEGNSGGGYYVSVKKIIPLTNQNYWLLAGEAPPQYPYCVPTYNELCSSADFVPIAKNKGWLLYDQITTHESYSSTDSGFQVGIHAFARSHSSPVDVVFDEHQTQDENLHSILAAALGNGQRVLSLTHNSRLRVEEDKGWTIKDKNHIILPILPDLISKDNKKE